MSLIEFIIGDADHQVTLPVDVVKHWLEEAGYTVLEPNTPVQFACGWDGRAVGVSEDRKKAQEAVDAAIEQGQVGRWELLERRVAPWTVAKPAAGGQFWREQK